MRGWRTVVAVVLALMAVAWSVAARQGTGGQAPPAPSGGVEALLGAALHQEEVEGNLRAAIAAYKQVLKVPGVTRTQSARAYLHIGLCHERLGQAEARMAFETVVKQFGDLRDVASQAETRLAALGASAGRAATSGPIPTWRTTGRGGLSCESFTSDGARLLCAGSDLNDFNDVWTLSVSGTSPKKLTNASGCGPGPEAPCELAGGRFLSAPDGTLVAYNWRSEQSGWHTRVSDLDGKVVRAFDRAVGDLLLDWSPDGASILVATWPFATRTTSLVSIAGADRREMLSGHKPSLARFSRDGRFVAFSEEKSGPGTDSDLFLATGGSREVVSLLAESSRADVIGWVPGDGGIVFASDRGGASGIWLLPMADGRPSAAPRLLRDGFEGLVASGQVLNDGTVVGLERRVGFDLHTAETEPAAGGLHRAPAPLFPQYTDTKLYPTWSPDGNKLAFYSNQTGAGVSDTLNVWHADTGERRQFKPGLRLTGPALHWTPDGSTLVVQATELDGSPGSIVRLSAKDGSIVGRTRLAAEGIGLVTLDEKYAYSPSMRPLKSGAILRVELATGEVRELWRDSLGRFPLRITLSPDHTRVLFGLGRQGKEPAVVMSLHVNGEPPSSVFTVPSGLTAAGWAWMPDGKSVVVVCGEPPVSSDLRQIGQARGRWYLVPVAGGTPRQLDLQSVATQVAVHPDSRRLVYAASTYRPPQLWTLKGIVRPTMAPSRGASVRD